MDIRKIYEYALQREHEGKRFFEENAGRLSHAAAVGAFKELAAEEQKHIEFIQSQIAALDKGSRQQRSPGKELERRRLLLASGLRRKCSTRPSLEAMVPDLPVLRTAYLIERDFAEFYEMSAKQADGEAQEGLKDAGRVGARA